ncbi:MAG: hypothetical protein A2287_06970 [Candidatus Melainabacteria bacterium RIFOXYA12_FULL_32_12]|nr:MAG: hypothetical protein A2255_07590 [Candidatus Melainabacteria bacterium RIFOXYA2_FULL_32_9]OGI24214.1 MAG: hypothetical protein A2287_06970 [Candidatus Melainabacteria bacterium RIFOXYA12_FULL_32_12]
MSNKFNEEKFIYTPAPKEKDAIPFWWCFPSTYQIGMASLGYLSLFRISDQNKDVYPERIFTNTEKTTHKISVVELAGFSFSFELDFLSIFKILEKYNIPFKASDRTEGYPLIFGGGPVLTANPEPYAEFFDFIITGEGEEIIPELVTAYKKIRHLSKKEKLIYLAQISGIYVPSLYNIEYHPDNTIKSFTPDIPEAQETVTRRCIMDLSKCIYSPILTEKSVFPNMFLIETARGCPKRCRFCLASYLSLPARYPDLEGILNAIDTGLEYSNKIGLLGALITEHPHFEKICEYLLAKRQEKEFEISVSSLRIDKITPLIVKMLVEGGQRNTTIAIEAGSEQLRKFINKNLSNEDILNGIKIARENGLTGLKVYGIIGLPSETEADITELINLMKEIKKENKGLKLTLSISSFVPKAHTPLQWDKREKNKTLQDKLNYLQKELNKAGILFKPTSLKWDYIQAVLSRGDRRLAPLLEKVYEYSGTLGSWGRAYKELTEEEKLDIPELDWYALREIPYDEILPWDFIDTGLNRKTLEKEREKAYK